jgi:hypothetical protein
MGTGPLRVAPLVDDPELAKTLERTAGILPDAENPEILIRQHKGGFTLCTPAGEQIASPNKGELVPYLIHQQWAKRLRAHQNAKSSFTLYLDTDGRRQAGLAFSGEHIVFRVGTERSIYPVLVDVDAAGLISVLYPGKTSELVRLEADQTRRLPPDKTSFSIEVKPAYGMDDVVLLGFTEKSRLLEKLVGATAAPGDPLYQTLASALMPDDPGIAVALLRLKTQDTEDVDAGCR